MTDLSVQLYRLQGGCCGVCGTRLLGEVKHLDHDHLTGLVRAWLCAGCNVGEGHGHEPHGRPGWAWDAYRLNPPAREFGIVLHVEHLAADWPEHHVLRIAERSRDPYRRTAAADRSDQEAAAIIGSRLLA